MNNKYKIIKKQKKNKLLHFKNLINKLLIDIKKLKRFVFIMI